MKVIFSYESCICISQGDDVGVVPTKYINLISQWKQKIHPIINDMGLYVK